MNNPAAIDGMLTGRINETPSQLLDDEILRPQFMYEVESLLNYYIAIERVLLLEYIRMGILTSDDAKLIDTVLCEIDSDNVAPESVVNLSDIAFAIERYVETHLEKTVSTWHVDRSRNDYQACAQLMLFRQQILNICSMLLSLSSVLNQKSLPLTEHIMPGYTHYQSAQVISPAFHLSALSDNVLQTVRRLLLQFDDINLCPLGAGPIAGQELDWDRERMSSLLGFNAPARHALSAVASRNWLLQVLAELSNFSVLYSRFVTDFINWGSGEYGFIDLPDEFAGISSAMPQKKNFTILERMRGKSAHVSSFYFDCILGMRNTPFTNLVEVSKEASAGLASCLGNIKSMISLSIAVIDSMEFNIEVMRSRCEMDYLEGFTLANYLTLNFSIPYRKSQVISGKYISTLKELNRRPEESNIVLLEDICKSAGYEVVLPTDILTNIFDVKTSLHKKKSLGSTNPNRVREMVLSLTQLNDELSRVLQNRNEQINLENPIGNR